jgi:hypothetical protein
MSPIRPPRGTICPPRRRSLPGPAARASEPVAGSARLPPPRRGGDVTMLTGDTFA